MLQKLKLAVTAAWTAAKKSIWGLLLLAFPYANDILALVDQYTPMLAPFLPANVFKLVGVVIVAIKFGLQMVGLIRKILAPRASGA